MTSAPSSLIRPVIHPPIALTFPSPLLPSLPLSYLPFHSLAFPSPLWPCLALPCLVDYKSSAEGRTRDFPVLLASERYDCSYFPRCPFLNMTCVRCHTDSSTPYILQCLTMPNFLLFALLKPHCPDLLCSVLPLTFPIIPFPPWCISPLQMRS